MTHSRPFRVCFTGNLSQPILEPLASMIHGAEGRVEINGIGQWTVDTGRICETIPLAPMPKEPLGFLKSRVKKSVKKTSTIQSPGSTRRSFKSRCLRLAMRVNDSIDRGLHSSRFRQMLSQSDLIHLHGAFNSRAFRMLAHGQIPKPLVVSLWGSDIFRKSDLALVAVQQKLFRKADAITVSSPEFRETVLAKYGLELRDKIHLTQFSPTFEGIQKLDAAEGRQTFRKSHSINDNSMVLCVGHNGTRECQHLELLTSLSRLPETLKQRLHIVVPMTYAGTPSYQSEVRAAAEQTGIEYTQLTEFMSDEEVASLRHASDLLIYAPVSDAFSATVTQFLATNTICILGSWLPYNTRRRAGLKYWEIDSPSDAGKVLESLLLDWQPTCDSVQENQQISFDFFDSTKLGTQWIRAYEAAAKTDILTVRDNE
ncbi:MAG: TDP-N-acetylfucosamine:lipid II N-acetylfucosaminyltransferase [Planctomycetota bacterium]